MVSRVRSAGIIGVDAVEVMVEVDASPGLPGESIIGFADKVIKESKNRIKSAIKNAGFKYPVKFFTINLSPADLPKEGAMFDLPIALGILQSTGQISIPPGALITGELSLDGDIKGIRGAICISELAHINDVSHLVIPYDNYQEAALTGFSAVYPLKNLQDIVSLFSEKPCLSFPPPSSIKQPTFEEDIIDVKGQFMAKRALEIAATGHHNILLIGPPGCGKSMLLKRLPTIMPDLHLSQAIEHLKVRSLSKQLKLTHGVTLQPIFRQPHHSISYAGMVGGGRPPQPGEISLSHHGILFLDELPEFDRRVIDVLRQPLEDKKLVLSRASFSVEYPADFMLVSAMNPCPCGYFNDRAVDCSCRPYQRIQYIKKISGPILDRFDIILSLPRLAISDYQNQEGVPLYSSEHIKNRIIKARGFQSVHRASVCRNASLSIQDLNRYCSSDKKTLHFLAQSVEKGGLTARSRDSVLKVARSIADLDGSKLVQSQHVLEAIQYRKGGVDVA